MAKVQHIDGRSVGAGRVVYRASRLEALLEPLLALVHAAPPEELLTPQTVLAAHPGMRHLLRCPTPKSPPRHALPRPSDRMER